MRILGFGIIWGVVAFICFFLLGGMVFAGAGFISGIFAALIAFAITCIVLGDKNVKA